MSVGEILETMEKNDNNLRQLISAAIPRIPEEQHCNCPHARDGGSYVGDYHGRFIRFNSKRSRLS